MTMGGGGGGSFNLGGLNFGVGLDFSALPAEFQQLRAIVDQQLGEIQQQVGRLNINLGASGGGGQGQGAAGAPTAGSAAQTFAAAAGANVDQATQKLQQGLEAYERAVDALANRLRAGNEKAFKSMDEARRTAQTIIRADPGIIDRENLGVTGQSPITGEQYVAGLREARNRAEARRAPATRQQPGPEEGTAAADRAKLLELLDKPFGGQSPEELEAIQRIQARLQANPANIARATGGFANALEAADTEPVPPESPERIEERLDLMRRKQQVVYDRNRRAADADRDRQARADQNAGIARASREVFRPENDAYAEPGFSGELPENMQAEAAFQRQIDQRGVVENIPAGRMQQIRELRLQQASQLAQLNRARNAAQKAGTPWSPTDFDSLGRPRSDENGEGALGRRRAANQPIEPAAPSDEADSPLRRRLSANNALRVQREAADAEAKAAAAKKAKQGGDDEGGGLMGFLKSEDALRFGSALLGINIGLSIAAGIARNIHAAIAAAVQSEEQFERAVRATTAAYGIAQSARGRTNAEQFVKDPTTRGTQAEYLSASAGFATTRQQLGFSESQISTALTAAGRLANVQSIQLPQAAGAVNQAVQGNVNALDQYGISLVNSEGKIISVNAKYEDLVSVVGRARAAQILLRDVNQQVVEQQEKVVSAGDGMAKAIDRIGKAAEEAGLKVGGLLSGPLAALINVGADLLEIMNDPSSTADKIVAAFRNAEVKLQGVKVFDLNAVPGMGGTLGLIQAYVQAWGPLIDAAKAAEAANTDAAKSEEKVAEATKTTTDALGAEIRQWEALALARKNAIERIGVTQQQSSEYKTVAEALKGPDADIGIARPGDVQQIGSANAAQDILAERARSQAQGRGQDMQAYLQAAVQAAREVGPTALAEAERQLNEFMSRAAARTAQVTAQLAGVQAQRASAEIQARVQTIQIEQSNRALGAQGELTGLKREELTLQGQIAPLALQQANLQDRITLAQRENLGTARQLLDARKAALGIEERMADLQYGQSAATARLNQIQARAVRGTATAEDYAEIPGLQRSLFEGALDQMEAGPAALAAQRRIDLAQRAQNREGLDRQGNLLDLEGERRALEDQTIPLQAALRLEQARTEAVQRRLEMENLGDAGKLATLQILGNQARQAQIDAERAAERARDAAASAGGGPVDPARVAALQGAAQTAAAAAADAMARAQAAGAAVPGAGNVGQPAARIPVENQALNQRAPGTGAAGVTPPPITLTIGSVNNMDDIRRIAREVGQETEQRIIQTLTDLFETTDVPVPGTVTGGTGGTR